MLKIPVFKLYPLPGPDGPQDGGAKAMSPLREEVPSGLENTCLLLSNGTCNSEKWLACSRQIFDTASLLPGTRDK